MDSDLQGLVPLLLFLAAILGFAATNMALTHVIGPRKRHKVKDMPYESGMDPVGSTKQHFDIKYYLVAVLFLVFDVELLFLYPWATAAYNAADPLPDGLRANVAGVMAVFLATLAIAYVYAWKKGVFEWR